MGRKKKSMFYKPARHKKLAEIVNLESPSKARSAARKLKELFRRARTRKEKRIIKQATVLAANRAKAARKKKNLSRKEKREFEEIADIYTEAYKGMEL